MSPFSKVNWIQQGKTDDGKWRGRAFLPYNCTKKALGNFPTSPSTCSTSSLVTANVSPVFCPFQLRSVTDEQHWTLDKGARYEACNIKIRCSTVYAQLHTDGWGVYITKCLLWPRTVPFSSWCPHQSHYLKKSPCGERKNGIEIKGKMNSEFFRNADVTVGEPGEGQRKGSKGARNVTERKWHHIWETACQLRE